MIEKAYKEIKDLENLDPAELKRFKIVLKELQLLEQKLDIGIYEINYIDNKTNVCEEVSLPSEEIKSET